MIVEGLLTTISDSGTVNLAPMGPIVYGDFESLTLRPFAGSTTLDNLVGNRVGVFHVVDHVDVMAKAAIRRLESLPDFIPAAVVTGFVLADCCRWFELEVTSIDTSRPRSELPCRVVHRGERRSFLGFNRARHAIIEAAILATRLHLLPQDDVQVQMKFLRPAVEKTGTEPDIETFRMIADYVDSHYAEVTAR